MSQVNPQKFLGQKSSPCRKCNGINAYVNSLGGISCQTCYPPRRPEYCLLRMVSESGVWTSEHEAFFQCAEPLPAAAPPQQAKTGPAGRDGQLQTTQPSATHPKSPIEYRRRKSSEPYDQREINWALEPGGIMDQMSAAAGTRRSAVSRTGETASEVADRLARFQDQTFMSRRLAPSSAGSVSAVTTEPLEFIVSEIPAESGQSIQRTMETFPAGTACLLFLGRQVPESDPEAGDIRASIAGRGKEARLMVVVRLPAAGGRLRILSEKLISVT